MNLSSTTLLLVCSLSILSGCGTMGEKRALLMNPARIHESADKKGNAFRAETHQINAYYLAMKQAEPDYRKEPFVPPSSQDIANYIDEGVALNIAYCRRWFHRIDASARKYDLEDKELNLIEALGTTALGIAAASAKTVTIWGVATGFLSAFRDTVSSSFFAEPSAKGIENKVMELLTAYGAQLKSDALSLKFSEAYTRLETMGDLCTRSSISNLLDASLKATDVKVNNIGAVIINGSVR